MRKFKSWTVRYGTAELVGTVTTVFGTWAVYYTTGSLLLAAFLGAQFEIIGFYTWLFWKDYSKAVEQSGDVEILNIFKNLFIEFGLSELLDTLFVRPFFLYWTPIVLGNIILGVIIGKILSDILFYVPAIIIFELREKSLRNQVK